MKYTAALVLAAAASSEAFGPFGGEKAAAPAPVTEAPKAFDPFGSFGGKKAAAPAPVKEAPKAFGPFGGKKAAAPAPVKEAPKGGKSIASTVFGMDLFAPKADQNDYGARGRKNLKQGTINAGSSYIPSGLSADEYNKIRKEATTKKEANYQRNVAKAGKFLDYTKFYIERGTDTDQSWAKSVTKGHRMAKTKYDWSGEEDKPLWAKKG